VTTYAAAGVLIILFAVPQAVVLFFSLYILALSHAGLLGDRGAGGEVGAGGRLRFAVLAAAHNEEAVIADLVASLKAQTYPSELYDVYVVADRCTDRTAVIAEAAGAKVYRRDPDERSAPRRSKASALRFFFDRIEAEGLHYAAYVIMDADNVVVPAFLQELSDCLEQGYDVVQGLRASKNPEENPVARLDDAAESVALLEQRGRIRLGLSPRLCGSAMALRESFLRAIGGWDPTCFSETVELMALSTLFGFRVGWCPGAISYDQKVSSISQLSGQRHRWLAGEFEVLRRYLGRLLLQGLRGRDPHSLELALYLCRMLAPRNVLIASCAVFLGLSLTERTGGLCASPWVWGTLLGGHLVSLLAALRVQGASWRTYAALALSPLFVLVYLRAAVCMIRRAPVQVKTEHDVKASEVS
jgi:hypothetical protein